MLRLLVMTHRLPLLLALLCACPGDVPEPGSSSDTSSTTILPSTGASSESSSTQGDESSSTTGVEVVCLEVASPDGGEVYYLCGPQCSNGCPVDELHVEAACVAVLPLGGKEPTSLCANLCKTDGWCSDGETCLAIAEGSFCVVLS
jgi:hypothetical protein